MLSVTILHYNREDLTRACLASVLRQDLTKIEHEILVVDNGSTHPFVVPDEQWEQVRVHRVATNVGNIAGQNLCLTHAKYDWVLFMSNDVTLKGTWDFRYLDGFLKHQHKNRTGQVMPIVRRPDGSIDSLGLRYRWPGYGLSIHRTKLYESEDRLCIPSIIYCLHKEAWTAAGGFDETLPGAYEDVDLGLRLDELDWHRTLVSSLEATHLGNATLQYTKKDRWRFHQARTQVVRKHFTGMDRLIRISTINCLDRIT